MDLETSSKHLLIDRVSFLDLSTLAPGQTDESVAAAENQTRDQTRIIFTHLPFELLPPNLLSCGARVVHVSRNPKDVLVSLFHHEKLLEAFYGNNGTVDDFGEAFLQGSNCYGNYFHMLRSAWKRRFEPNLKMVWYEDMKRDVVPVIKDLCAFLDVHLSEEKIRELEQVQKIDKFRARQVSSAGDKEGKEMYKKFFRKGQVGDWKNHFKVGFNERIDQWVELNLKELEGVKIQYEI